jgi:hypothetical protein
MLDVNISLFDEDSVLSATLWQSVGDENVWALLRILHGTLSHPTALLTCKRGGET